MVYVDNEFDWNDPLAKKYLLYKGIYYDVGTKVLIRGNTGIQEAVFTGWQPYTGKSFQMQHIDNAKFGSSYGANKYIVEVLNPVYADLSEYDNDGVANGRVCPPQHEVEIGWIWYIVIMLGGLLFKEVLLIWICATAIFFGWKNGFLNGGKK